MKIFSSCAILMAFLMVAPAPGQMRRRGGGGGAAIGEITSIINDCERRTNDFKRTLRRALNNSRLDDSRREDRLNDDADRLERALDRVGDSWNRDRDIGKTRSYVSEAISVSQNINRTMRNRRMGGEAEREWSVVRGELNRLAMAFRLPSIRW